MTIQMKPDTVILPRLDLGTDAQRIAPTGDETMTRSVEQFGDATSPASGRIDRIVTAGFCGGC
jgi:hypothetical protein